MTVTIEAIARHAGISPRLVRAVIRQLGGKSEAFRVFEDIARHGANAGWRGFSYYSDTVSFFKRNRADIVELLQEQADSFGEDPAAMVAGFNCLCPADRETRQAVMRCLGGGSVRANERDVIVANALAWFAAEEVARAYVDAAEL